MYTVPSTGNRLRIDSRRCSSWRRHPFPLHLLPNDEVDTGEQVKLTRRIEDARKVIARRADIAATPTRDNARVTILYFQCRGRRTSIARGV